MAKGWFRRKKGKLLYCWYNASGDERSKVVGLASLTDAEGWLKVGEVGHASDLRGIGGEISQPVSLQ